jgi:hypothetical protein
VIRHIFFFSVLSSLFSCTREEDISFEPIAIRIYDDIHKVIQNKDRLCIYSGYVWSHCIETQLKTDKSLLRQDTISDKALFDIYQFPSGDKVAVGVDGYFYTKPTSELVWSFHRLSHWDILHSIKPKKNGYLASGGKAFERGYIYHIGSNYSIDTVQYFGFEISDIENVGDQSWVAVGWGNIMYSSDDARTWSTLANEGDFYVDVLMIDKDNGFVIGINGNLLGTNDGGKSWTRSKAKIPQSGFDTFRSIHLLRDGALVITGSKGRFWISQDNGHDWKVYTINDNREIEGLLQLDSHQIILYGSKGLLGTVNL